MDTEEQTERRGINYFGQYENPLGAFEVWRMYEAEIRFLGLIDQANKVVEKSHDSLRLEVDLASLVLERRISMGEKFFERDYSVSRDQFEED